MPGDPVQSADLLERGASSALPQSGATGGPAAQNPAQVQALLEVLKNVAKPQGASGPTTTAQSSIPPYQAPSLHGVSAPQVAQGPFASVGARKRADKQAMLNNIAHVATDIKTKYYERQTREMTHLVERIQGATQGKQQAEAILKQDPNNAEAKQQLQQNSKILEDIFSDPKNGKKLQKAFDVPLIGDKGKATPEYQGLMQALRNKDKEATAQAGGAMAQRFQQQFPSTQQPSPQTQMLMAMTKAGVVPKAGEQLKAQTDMFRDITNLSRTMDTNATREAIAQKLVEQKDRGLANDLIKMSMAVNGRQQTAGIIAEAAVKRTRIMANQAGTDVQWRMAGGILEKQIATEGKGKQASGLKSEYDTVNKELKNLQTDIDNLSWTDRKGIKEKTQRIQELRQRQGQIVQRMDSLGYAGSTSTTGSGTTSGQQDAQPDSFDRIFEGLLNESGASSEDSSQ